MLCRCNNPNSKAYRYYGGKGIKCHLSKEDVAFLWKRDKASDMERPSISRHDHDGDYTIENCCFEEFSENSRESALRNRAKRSR